MKNNLCIVMLLCIFFSAPCFARTENIYQFKTVQQQQQFHQLTEELRCLVCQNETLADSGAALAKDLRDQIAVMVQKGESDQQIIHYLVARYGDFILYNPPLNPLTYVLWFGPLALLLIGIFIAVIIIWQRHRRYKMKTG